MPLPHPRDLTDPQRMESLAEKDQRAVIRLINSLVASNGNGHSRGNAHP
jgi:hypothetical protein